MAFIFIEPGQMLGFLFSPGEFYLPDFLYKQVIEVNL